MGNSISELTQREAREDAKHAAEMHHHHHNNNNSNINNNNSNSNSNSHDHDHDHNHDHNKHKNSSSDDDNNKKKNDKRERRIIHVEKYVSRNEIERVVALNKKELTYNYGEEFVAEHDRWDEDFVKLPFNPHNVIYVVAEEEEEEEDEKPPHITITVESRWNHIQTAMKKKMSSAQDIQDAILSYNPKYKHEWNFGTLHKFIDERLEERDRVHFFDSILPFIQELVLRTPELFPKAIPMLRQGMNQSVTFTQEQASCIVANGFFCTFPNRNSKFWSNGLLPDLNFRALFSLRGHHNVDSQMGKLLCLMHYFDAVRQRPQEQRKQGKVTVQRRYLPSGHYPKWKTSNTPLSKVSVDDDGIIEDAVGMLQADFANAYIGGGALSHGCVQEEIRFMICPELIAANMVCEAMNRYESIWIIGVEQFSRYTGYARSFDYAGPYNDTVERDRFGHKKTVVVAMDALIFSSQPVSVQFDPAIMEREMEKAYVTFAPSAKFSHNDNNNNNNNCSCKSYLDEEEHQPIATGNWGCGAFKGDKQLKAILQWLAASEAKRDMVYFTFKDKKLAGAIVNLTTAMLAKSLTVGDVYSALLQMDSDSDWKVFQALNKHFDLGADLESEYIPAHLAAPPASITVRFI